MLLSAIVTVFNCEKFVDRMLQSILSQTLHRIQYEIIIVNDGSKDKTKNILQKYSNEIKIIDQPNHGIVYSTNKAINQSKGRYIIRMDCDDYIDETLFASTSDILEKKHDYDCVYTDRFLINSDNKKKPIKVKNDVFDTIACGVLFRREVFDSIGFYDDMILEEYDFMIRFKEAGLKAYHFKKSLYYYVKHTNNISTTSYLKDGMEELKNKWGEKITKYETA